MSRSIVLSLGGLNILNEDILQLVKTVYKN